MRCLTKDVPGRSEDNMKHLQIMLYRSTIAATAICVAAAITCLSTGEVGAQSSTAKSEVAGRWQGKFPSEDGSATSIADAPVAVEIAVKDDAGKISGTAIFFVIRNNGDKPEVKGRVESELVEPRFDGTALTFSIKTNGPRGAKEDQIQMQMKLTSPVEAELENLDDSAAPLFKMKKVP